MLLGRFSGLHCRLTKKDSTAKIGTLPVFANLFIYREKIVKLDGTSG
jgi:hypothetical protein